MARPWEDLQSVNHDFKAHAFARVVTAGEACNTGLNHFPPDCRNRMHNARWETDLTGVRSKGNGSSRSLVFYIEKCYIAGTMEVAVIKTGGKQYVVSKGDTIAIEKLPGDLKKGDTVVFNEVLLVDNGSDTTIGAPVIKGAEVKGTVVLAGLDKKVEVVKYKPKSRYFKRKGHRQPILKVKIDSIS